MPAIAAVEMVLKVGSAAIETAGVGAPKLGAREFKHFQQLLFEVAGIHLSAVKQSMVEGRLSKRIKVLQLPDFASYCSFLQQNAGEQQTVVDLLTTNETYFFREPKHFDFLRERILTQRSKSQPFDVWSAACSTGEEPYSVAMLLDDQLAKSDWSILASDISTQVLAKARLGRYSLHRTENIPSQYLKRYCLRGVGPEAGNLLIDKNLRARIEFRQVNLMQSLDKLRKFDLVLLRNVLIYFNPSTKQQVLQRLALRLKPGGFLFIGHSETLNGLTTGLTQVAPAIYRRPE